MNAVLVGVDCPELCTLRGQLESVNIRCKWISNMSNAIDRDAIGDTAIVLMRYDALGPTAKTFCRTLRWGGCNQPIVALADVASEADKVEFLDAGGDGLFQEAIDFDELLSRCLALIRLEYRRYCKRLRCGQLEFDLTTGDVWQAGRAIAVTRREFEVLVFLALNEGQPVAPSALRVAVWGASSEFSETDPVDLYVARLRRKLRAASDGYEALVRNAHGEIGIDT